MFVEAMHDAEDVDSCRVPAGFILVKVVPTKSCLVGRLQGFSLNAGYSPNITRDDLSAGLTKWLLVKSKNVFPRGKPDELWKKLDGLETNSLPWKDWHFRGTGTQRARCKAQLVSLRGDVFPGEVGAKEPPLHDVHMARRMVPTGGDGSVFFTPEEWNTELREDNEVRLMHARNFGVDLISSCPQFVPKCILLLL